MSSSIPPGLCSTAEEVTPSKFHEIVDQTVKSHVCSHVEVIQVCSRWFITEKRDMADLPRVLEIYGELRDRGTSHNAAFNGLFIMLLEVDSIDKLGTLPSKELPEHRLIRED
jgi:hypothetical protein